MAVQHVITDTDTLELIADLYFNDPSKRMAIIDYNGLDYPYIVPNRAAIYDYYASGYLTMTRASSGGGVVLKAGSTFATKASMIDGIIKEYEVTTDTMLTAGDLNPCVLVRCRVAGNFGNVLPNTITEIGNIMASGPLTIVGVNNPQGFVNGREATVKAVGDVLFIPVDITDLTMAAPTDINSYLTELGGEDIDLTGGQISFENGDLKSISGLANIVQAIVFRLVTERMEYPLHPPYGTDHVIGAPQLPYAERLEELNILESLAQENRIQDSQILELSYEATAMLITIAFRPAGAGNGVDYQIVKLKLNYRGGQ